MGLRGGTHPEMHAAPHPAVATDLGDLGPRAELEGGEF